jgi:arylformamidase
MKLWDISPVIAEDLAVFPGDLPFSREISLSFERGHYLTLSSIRTTLHLGAHADSPSHYHPQGKGIDEVSLEPYLGLCQVIQLNLPRGERIFPRLLEGMKIEAARVLFRTGSFPDPRAWNDDFNSLSPELVEFLADRGVRLVGIDTPSIDPADSKALESHQAIFRRSLAVLEGLVLEKVPAGLYSLIALPLRLNKADASPVRAILLESGALGG